jgi:diguanylate cyclase (GGDEF)-like protein
MTLLSGLIQGKLGGDFTTRSKRALIEEHYWSLRRQAPIVYLLGIVNISAMEIAATGTLSVGFNVQTFIAACGLLRMWHWYGSGRGTTPSHEIMAKRLRQTVWFAAAVCLAVCARCLYLLQVGDTASHMAVLLFGGLTAIGIAYGLTALPIAGWIPLILIIGPLSVTALLSHDRRFAGAAFGLVVVAALTSRLLGAHSQHFTTVIRSRSVIAREQEVVEHARQEAIIAATTDFLTGLPNRRALVAALDTAASERTGSFALAILDLDRFKAVNDTFGHAIGDQLLKEVAARLVKAVGARGLVARLGGDEFGVLLPEVRNAKDAQAIGGNILLEVNGPAFLNGREFTIAASCGMGLSRKREDFSPSRLMADADLALYQAKENPGGGVALFELRMEAPRRRRAQIERALQLPGVHDNLRVVFQPIFDLKTGRIIANEALARWSDPELGAIAPSEFVPIAEQLNLIDDINCRLMGLAFEAAHLWPDDIKLSFNLSAIQLCSAGTADSVLRALRRNELAPERLQVEVTETSLLADFECARANLTGLRNAGATIILDDFGAGYASIGYLRELRFDQIKLDGGLVTAAQHSADGKRLLRAVIGLCEILGVSTVAEHVESKELLALVMELGCSAAQGFWLERPLEREDVRKLFGAKMIPLPARHRRHAA